MMPDTEVKPRLNEAQQRLLHRLRSRARWLDARWHVAGVRVGWDSIIGLIPGVGDLISAALGLSIVLGARKLHVPARLQGRMLLNLALEALLGELPLLGDVGDIFWRANIQNVELLEAYLQLPDCEEAEAASTTPLWLGAIAFLLALSLSLGVAVLLWYFMVNLL